MSTIGYVVRSPINIETDLGVLLGTGSGDVGVNCKSGMVNKWSFRKPVRWNPATPRTPEWETLTNAEMASIHCGLAPVAVAKLLKRIIGNTSYLYTYDKEECLQEVSEWPYYQPRGLSYDEPFRVMDFDAYKHNAVAPDGGWLQLELDDSDLDKMKDTTVDVDVMGGGGDADVRNYKFTPKYNGSTINSYLYSAFSMRFGVASGEEIGDSTNMDIPIEYIADITGNWRIAIAVWIESYGSYGGWGIFAGRETIKQYRAEGGGTGSLAKLLPDFATNPSVAYLMRSEVTTAGGFKSFDAVPLLVKDLGYTNTQIGGQNRFCLCTLDDVTEAYCMPSGTNAMQVACGEPPVTIWFDMRYERRGGVTRAFLINKDTENSHEFIYSIIVDGVTQQPTDRYANLAASETRQVGATATGYVISIVVTKQDNVPLT